MSRPKLLTLTEIAGRINAHLERFEADPKINKRNAKYSTRLYYYAHAWRGGNRVGIKYVSYQHTTKLTRAEALAYLVWLDAGNVGRHYEQQREQREAAGEEVN